jgi:hypothetical protein
MEGIVMVECRVKSEESRADKADELRYAYALQGAPKPIEPIGGIDPPPTIPFINMIA